MSKRRSTYNNKGRTPGAKKNTHSKPVHDYTKGRGGIRL